MHPTKTQTVSGTMTLFQVYALDVTVMSVMEEPSSSAPDVGDYREGTDPLPGEEPEPQRALLQALWLGNVCPRMGERIALTVGQVSFQVQVDMVVHSSDGSPSRLSAVLPVPADRFEKVVGDVRLVMDAVDRQSREKVRGMA